MVNRMGMDPASLDELSKRIETSDLVPSRACLACRTQEKMRLLEGQGIDTLGALRKELKSAKRIAALAEATGIDASYLHLLRREIESYVPKPVALVAFDWLPKDEIAKLERCGIRDTASLHDAASAENGLFRIEETTRIDSATLGHLCQLADLMRIQWVSPTFARMLAEAGYGSAAKVAAAHADSLCEAVARINAGARFFNGKIGLRDIRRLIHAARYA